MRVLVIAHGYPPAAQAGAEIYAAAHAHALRAQGHEVTVLAREDAPGRPEHEVRESVEAGIPVVWINNTFRSVRTFAESYRNPSINRLVERILDRVRPEAAHLHHLTGLSTSIVHALAARGVPRVMTLHDYWLLCHRGQLLDRDGRVCDGPDAEGRSCRGCMDAAAGLPPAAFAAAAALRSARMWRPLTGVAHRMGAAVAGEDAVVRAAEARAAEMRAVCRAMTHFLAPSRALRDRFIRWGVEPSRISYAPYGFARAPAAPARGPSSDRLRIGFVGTLMLSKAPQVLLDAFRQLPANRAVVDLIGPRAAYHGDASYQDRLEPLLALPGVRAHGAVPHAEIARRLADIDVLVVPSIWPENSPLVIHEAFMAGVPVIASKVGGIPETVRHEENGLLVEPGDVGALAGALRRCLDEPALLPRLRDGIAPVRDIADDVAAAAAWYRVEAPAPSRRTVAAIVLNHRTPDDTLLAVRSLLASDTPPANLLVVNNDAQADPGLRAWLAPAGAPAACLETGANLGFSGGMNVGIREALARGADYVLIANSDVIVPPNCLARLIRALDANPAAGIAGPAVVSRSDPGRLESLGLSFSPVTGRMRVVGAGTRVADHDLSASHAVDAVSGCLMLVKRAVFEAAGLFDEAYFFGFEDLDFCLRARRAGFATIVAGGARACHEGGRSIGAASPRRLYFAARNHLRLAERMAGAGGASPVLRTWSIVALNLAHAARPGGGHIGARLAAVVRGTRDHWRKRYGPDAVAT